MDLAPWAGLLEALDKSSWGPGPWQDEPDQLAWEDERTGYPCFILRQEFSGSLCGYVAVREGHPWYGKECSEIDAYVHGGITYSGPYESRIDGKHYWIAGFECQHAEDITPALDATLRADGFEWPEFMRDFRKYRDISYVREQCSSLAGQAAAASKEITDGPERGLPR